jgi:UPF0716 protein FxsA
MVPLAFLVLIVVPIAELWVIVEAAQRIGLLATLALLILVSGVGAWLLKQQGLAVWRRLQETLGRGQMPTQEITDGALILFGGALLLTPGFLTDAVGVLLLIPATRGVVKGAARRLLGRWALRRRARASRTGRIYSSFVSTARDRDAARDRPHPRPLGDARSDEGGSRDRG